MTTTSNSARKTVGHAIHGLRPYIKALELARGITVSQGEYRYQISEDRGSARIICNPVSGADTPLSEWVTVESTERAISDWAQIGKQVRLAFIGLKATKEKHRLDGDHVQFTLNVLTEQAFLSRNGEVLTDYPTTIADWAPVGREVEVRYFESYNAALEWNNQAAAAGVRATMERLGILRSERVAK
ncbi:MAG TPA: hypothetical protein V6C89_10250 [Drouetiella sp.]